jgi:hypothetical protein
VDALLEGRQSGHRTFSRRVVLRRYHHRMGLWDNVVYRWRLLRVRCCAECSWRHQLAMTRQVWQMAYVLSVTPRMLLPLQGSAVGSTSEATLEPQTA